ncbi:hypothetical protein PYW07_012788 [Mythimna separata]|uniref:EGF-like domain-containing protein n=1 Tax=Mythimna separata TaxID=271217 RepID=A0AAD7Y8X1_MYTSE|nr:hypothetical protein PYW07_012788 [Mythimna separata]
MHSTRVVAVLTLVVGLAHCLSWDIVVGGDKQLHFYYNGTLTHTEEIAATQITSVTYDPVHYRVLFTDVNYPSMIMSSFDLATRKIQSLFTTTSNDYYMRVVYDPVTQLLVWKTWYNIYTFSLNPASSDKAVDGNLLVTMHNLCRDIAVDSCGGYIYWITDYKIERARLDGSEREVIVDSSVYYRLSLAIDQQTQRLYWIDCISANGGRSSIESANLNGKNRTTFYIVSNAYRWFASSLAVSKDFIYWQNSDEVGTWQLPKNSSEHVARKLYSISSLSDWSYQLVATNYTIQEQIKGIHCEALQGLIPNNSKPEPTASICQNYCLEGNCSVNAGGQPTCSCRAGHSGERCEINACHQYCLHNGVCSLNEEKEPVCQCTADYYGQRCEISICKEYCFQGNCSLGTDAQPKCSCEAGYSGARCEVNACHEHCLNNGTCTLNEEDEPFCECTADYEGQRCDVAITHAGDCADNLTQQVLRDLRSGVRQVFKEELKRILQLFSDKLDEDEAKK